MTRIIVPKAPGAMKAVREYDETMWRGVPSIPREHFLAIIDYVGVLEDVVQRAAGNVPPDTGGEPW